MISVIYCTREHNPKHSEHIKKMAGHPKVEVIEYVNNGESLTKVYNKLLTKTKYDIVVFLHDDIEIQTKQFAKKIKRHFDRTDYGILGVAGTKSLPESGKWWAELNKMYGRVYHTHNGKKTLSKYSDDLGNKVEEVVIVDGVFFSVMKSRLKENFDETVKGFHFYDVDFCFRNYLKGVKVGVHTNISINHMSIGETNEQWEENRKAFSEKYKNSLPIKIDKEFGDNPKFKVLLSCLNFNSYTGSELYNFELAKGLVNMGCDVTICSNCGGEIARRAKTYGIKLANINEPIGYKRGDGKWQIKDEKGNLIPSTKNSLYRVGPANFDIIHSSHTPVTKLMTQIYPEIPIISSIHSEIISLEEPVVHDNVKSYVAIRPEIKDFLINKHNISEDKISVIYNPIDSEKFKVIDGEKNNNGRVLFVGTIDYLRKNTLIDLVNVTKNSGKELWIVGKENDVKISDIIGDNEHVTHFKPSNKIEDYIHQCDETAGILLGRSTIEGWLCGKAGWIYDVDDKGTVLSKKLHEVPEDIDKFKAINVTNKVIEEYKNILK